MVTHVTRHHERQRPRRRRFAVDDADVGPRRLAELRERQQMAAANDVELGGELPHWRMPAFERRASSASSNPGRAVVSPRRETDRAVTEHALGIDEVAQNLTHRPAARSVGEDFLGRGHAPRQRRDNRALRFERRQHVFARARARRSCNRIGSRNTRARSGSFPAVQAP